MSYFPDEIMPSNVKKDSLKTTELSSSKMYADEFNTNDEEIRAIESYLVELSSDVNTIISKLNSITDPFGGIQTLSGSVTSGKKIQFPEPCIATYLTNAPTTTDTVIQVSSTNGFPARGIISLINKVDLTTKPESIVEWIRYSSKTETEFRQCERGFKNSFIGEHSGTISTSGNAAQVDNIMFPNNKSQVAKNLPHKFPGRRNKVVYLIPSLGWAGVETDLIRRLLYQASTSLFLSNPAIEVFLQSAGEVGILTTNEDGSFKILSTNGTAASLNQLTWTESVNLYNSLLEKGLIIQVRTPVEYDWSSQSIPVFQGYLTISASASTYIRGSSVIDLTGTRIFPSGEILIAVNSKEKTDNPQWASVSYQLMLIPSFTGAEDSQQFSTKG